MELEATLHVTVKHVAGPKIADPDHVRRWLCTDRVALDGEFGGYTYAVCPECPDPEDCDCYGTEDSVYRVSIVSADW